MRRELSVALPVHDDCTRWVGRCRRPPVISQASGIMLTDYGTLLMGVHFSDADAVADEVSWHSAAQRANKS